MKFDQFKINAVILTKAQIECIKGGTNESVVTSSIIIIEDIDAM